MRCSNCGEPSPEAFCESCQAVEDAERAVADAEEHRHALLPSRSWEGVVCGRVTLPAPQDQEAEGE